MKYVAYVEVPLGFITTERMAQLPDKFADPNSPTERELRRFFAQAQDNLAESNSGSEAIMNSNVLIRTMGVPAEPTADAVMRAPSRADSKPLTIDQLPGFG